MKILSVLLIWVFVFLSGCKGQETQPPAAASGETLRPEMEKLQQQMAEQRQLLEEIRSQVAEVKSDLDGIKKSVRDVPRPPSGDQEIAVSIDDDYIRGNPNAKLTLVEFSDFQCPFCERFYKETLPLIEKEYIQTGKVRMVYRDFPLESIHKDAMKAAEAAQCAGEQGKFWDMHDKLFENAKALGVDQLKIYAKDLGLSPDLFDQCLDSGKHAQEVRKDLMDGQAVGVEGTPTFYVGYTQKGKAIQGTPIRGARPYISFKQAFDKMLQGK